MSRIVWTDEEILAIAKQALEYQEVHEWSDTIAADYAQRVILPVERHRLLNSKPAAVKVIRKMCELRDHHMQGVVEELESVNTKEMALSVTEELKKIPYGSFAHQEIIIHTLSALGEEVMVNIIKRAITNPEIAPLIRQFLNQQMPTVSVAESIPKHNPEPVQIKNNRRTPTILICGMKSNVIHNPQSFVNGKLRLKFFNNGETNFEKLMDKASDSDRVIVCTEAFPHRGYEYIKRAGHSDWYRNTGAISGVNKLLSAIMEDYGIE